MFYRLAIAFSKSNFSPSIFFTVVSFHVKEAYFLMSCMKHSTCGGGGFFLARENFGRMFNDPFPACAFFFFFEVQIRLRTLIPLFRPGSAHSGPASLDNCGRVFPDELRVSSFPDRFPHYVYTTA